MTIELREEFTLVKKRKYLLRWYIIINNVAIYNNTIEILQTVNGGYDFLHFSLKGIVIKDEDLFNLNFAGCRLQNAIF